MPIWALRMTKALAGIRHALRMRRLSTMCAPMVCLGLAFGANAAQAGTAWELFVARCLDPFEHLSLPVVDGLKAQSIDQMHEARRVYGPTAEGYLLVLDVAPREGERACLVEVAGKEVSQAETEWRAVQTSQGRYVPNGGWLISNEWIEPRVKMRSKATAARTVYEMVETDLES